MTEIYELATSDDGLSYSPFEVFEPGDVRQLANYVKFRVTVYGDFDTDDYRLRGFSGISDDATLVEGGFGLSPFGRFPFGDGGVCLEDSHTELPPGFLDMSGELTVFIPTPVGGELALDGDLEAVFVFSGDGTLSMSGDLDIEVFSFPEGSLSLSGALDVAVLLDGELDLAGTLDAVFSFSAAGSLSMSGDLDIEVFSFPEGSLSFDGDLDVAVFADEDGSLQLTGSLVAQSVHAEVGSMAMTGSLAVEVFAPESGSLSLSGSLDSELSNFFAALMTVGVNGPSSSFTPTSTNIYFDLGSGTVVTATVGNAQRRMPMSATFNRMYVMLNAALTGGQSCAIRLNINGTGSNTLKVVIATPSTPAVAQVVTSTGNLTNGSYRYKTTFVIDGFEQAPSAQSAAVTVDATHKQVTVSSIATGPTGTTARNLYRTIANGATFFLLTTINDNSTTSFGDNIADASLGAAAGTGLLAGRIDTSVSLAQDDLVCFEATDFVGAASVALTHISMQYFGEDGFLLGRMDYGTTVANTGLAGFGTNVGAGLAAIGTTNIPKQVTILEGTLVANTAPGGVTATNFQMRTNGNSANAGTAASLSGASTSSRTTMNAVLPGTTTGATADNHNGLRTSTGSPAASQVRNFFSYVADSPDEHYTFYNTGRGSFNHSGLNNNPFPPITGFNAAVAFSTTEAGAQMVWPSTGKFKYFGARAGTTAGTTFTVTLRINGSPTALVLSFSGATTWQQDYTTEVSVNAGDLVCYQVTRTGGAATALDLNATIGFTTE